MAKKQKWRITECCQNIQVHVDIKINLKYPRVFFKIGQMRKKKKLDF